MKTSLFLGKNHNIRCLQGTKSASFTDLVSLFIYWFSSLYTGFPLYILVFVFIYWFSFWGFGGIGRKEVKSANLAEIGAFELGERKLWPSLETAQSGGFYC